MTIGANGESVRAKTSANAPTRGDKKVMILGDGFSLAAMKAKGNLGHYVETLYNPGNRFAEAHIIAFDEADLAVQLENPTLRVHYLKNYTLARKEWSETANRIARYFTRGASLPAMVLQAARIVRREKIDVIRARNAYLAGMITVLVGKMTNTPTVVSLGGDNRIAQELLKRYYLYNRKASFAIEEFALKNATRVFCVNEFTRQYAIRLGVKPENAKVVPHRVDVDLLGKADPIEARKELGIGDRPMVLFVGRYEPDKQIDVCIEAIPGILAKHPNACFVFIGDGSMRGWVENRIKELKIEHAVILAGYQKRPAIAKYFAACSACWIPMSGFVIYEAAAAKRPIVAFDVEWHSEFVEHEKTGLLVRDRDVADVVEKMNRVLGDRVLAERLAQGAERHFREKYDRATLEAQEYALYLEAIEAKR